MIEKLLFWLAHPIYRIGSKFEGLRFQIYRHLKNGVVLHKSGPLDKSLSKVRRGGYVVVLPNPKTQSND